MFALETIFEFSRNNCVAICSFLVPANLISTIAILGSAIKASSSIRLRYLLATSIAFAVSLFLHVSTWFLIGVVTPVTFILLTLGASCLLVSVLAIVYQQKLSSLFSSLNANNLLSRSRFSIKYGSLKLFVNTKTK